jgi:multidrug efflux pump subunit AcrB
MDGTQEIGLAVLATTLSIVAVFLPIGFMGGIIGKFFHEFGITMVAAVLISMFVSFTLDPMLSSVWHDPEIEKHGKHLAPVSLYDRTIGRVTGWFDRVQDGWPTPTRARCAGRSHTSSPPWRWRWRCLSAACSCCRCWAPSSCPRPTSPKPR